MLSKISETEESSNSAEYRSNVTKLQARIIISNAISTDK
jgi:hypothetical protein